MWDNKYNEANQSFNSDRLNKRNRRIIKIFAVSIIVIIFLGIFGSVVYNAGYIPIKRFMPVKSPLGEADEIDIDEHLYKHPEIKNFPYIDRLKYKIFGTNKSIDAVANDYKKQLKDEGFNLLYNGEACRRDIPFRYYGYLKGITGVGIIITDDETITLNYETMVLYTTGSALDYREILTWYKNNIDMIEGIDL
jgi:hypothetical protein